MKLEITNEEMQKVYHFIRQSVYDLKHLTSNHENIIVAIPSLALYNFKHYPMYVYLSLQTPENELSENLFFGVKTQPHFNNEIVVFYKYYYRNPELFKPRIYQLKFVEDEKAN